MKKLFINGDSVEIGDGATFTPSVSEDGVLSWTNDGGLENPEPVNIRGPQGIQGIQGIQGEPGQDATINGQNTLEIVSGDNVSIAQHGSTLTIAAHEVYSTEEARIGTWIDGKPLYQKVLKGKTPSNIDAFATISNSIIENLQYIVSWNGGVSTANGFHCFLEHADGNAIITITYYEYGGGLQVKVSHKAYINSDIFVILKYTKTTD